MEKRKRGKVDQKKKKNVRKEEVPKWVWRGERERNKIKKVKEDFYRFFLYFNRKETNKYIYCI